MKPTETMVAGMLNAREQARVKAVDALSRYKFEMFGYWAAKWVQINQYLSWVGLQRGNPFAELVHVAREIKAGEPSHLEKAS